MFTVEGKVKNLRLSTENVFRRGRKSTSAPGMHNVDLCTPFCYSVTRRENAIARALSF